MLRSYFIPPAGNARSVFIAAVLLSAFAPVAVGQAKDPGPRAGAAGAGSYFSTLNANEQQTFLQALARFQAMGLSWHADQTRHLLQGAVP